MLRNFNFSYDFFKFLFIIPFGLFFSLSLARFTDARLLCFISISSTFKALETVNLKSRLSTGPLSLSLLFPAGLLSFLIKSLVACCSINLRAKFFFLVSGLKLVLGFDGALLNDLFDLKGFFFSTEKDFLPEVEIVDVTNFYFRLEEIVSVLFLSFSITLLVRYLSSSHN